MAARGIFYLCSLVVRPPVAAKVLFSRKMVLNWPLKSLKILFIKPLGDPKIQQIVTAAIDDKFVNSRESGENRERNKEERRKFSYALFLGFITSCLVSFPSVVNAAGGDDEEKENFARGLRFKGRFVSQQKACILNNLAKANSKRPMEKKTFENGEPEPKRVTRSQMVSSVSEIVINTFSLK